MRIRHGSKREIGAMIAVSAAVILLLCAVVFGFHLIVQEDREIAEGASESSGSSDYEENTEMIAVATSVPSDEDADDDPIILVRGDIHRSNRYDKVDHLGYTDEVKYTKSSLSLLDSDGLRVTRNEIFARHGKMFNDQTLQEYFNEKPWYVPRYAPDKFDEKALNSVEQYNVRLIRSFEINNGMNAELEK